MQAWVFRRQTGPQPGLGQGPCGFRNEYLAAVAGARHAGGPMDVEAEILVADERRFSSMEANPDSDLPAVRPGMPCQHRLQRPRACARVQRALEHDEKRVAFGAELLATVSGEGLALDRVVREQHVRVTVAEL